MSTPRIGIMQGRLVPPETEAIQAFPRRRWRDEFELAAKAELDCIEWIYDVYGADINPLHTDEGVATIRELSTRYGIAVNSICADYFMEHPFLVRDLGLRQERIERLIWLVAQGAKLGARYILLPFVDASCLRGEKEITEISELLDSVLSSTQNVSVELHLETALPPNEFVFLLSLLPSLRIKANYDSGNSASLGYDVREEFAAYGERVSSVHIKDRVLGGGTVPLGAGATEFALLFEELQRYEYAGDFVLQVARGKAGEEVSWARQNCEFVLRHFNKSLKDIS